MQVVGLYTATAAGAPMIGHAEVEVQPGVGIVGDRYATGRGHWSDPRWPDQELTLVEAEVAAVLGMEAAALRRNVVTRDVRLHDLVGVRFRIGEVLLEGVRPCAPCRYLETLTRPGLVRALTGRGGLRARILTAGRLRVGDPIAVLASPATAGPLVADTADQPGAARRETTTTRRRGEDTAAVPADTDPRPIRLPGAVGADQERPVSSS